MNNASELLKQIRELKIKSKRLSSHILSGEYHSAFRGRGMTFKEVREYTAGDDIRFIDWNVSARMGSTYSKIFEEERELNVYLLIDSSASTQFGTQGKSKRTFITEIAATLAFNALNNNDKVALLFCTNKVEKFIPLAKGKAHSIHLLRELISFTPASKETNLVKGLQYINKIARHRCIVFILSDFADMGYHESLMIATQKHDVIGVQVYDYRDEILLDNIGWMQLQDSETGRSVLFNSRDYYARLLYKTQRNIIHTEAKKTFQFAGADLIQIRTDEDFVKPLHFFFLNRK